MPSRTEYLQAKTIAELLQIKEDQFYGNDVSEMYERLIPILKNVMSHSQLRSNDFVFLFALNGATFLSACESYEAAKIRFDSFLQALSGDETFGDLQEIMCALVELIERKVQDLEKDFTWNKNPNVMVYLRDNVPWIATVPTDPSHEPSEIQRLAD